mmetsp:Transcript_76025/g.199401  ORF Transcript_76025/g.199401 Transcript_76025/m.199401 type:complete len:202 (-) Transcript_76025:416-1021(-)
MPRRLHGVKQDVLWFQVSVRQLEAIVQEAQGLHALLCKALDVLRPEAPEPVVLQEVVQRHAQRLEDQAIELRLVSEGLVHDGTARPLLWIRLANVLQDVGLDLGILHVALHVADDLDGHLPVARALVVRKHNTPEGAIAEQLDQLVPRVQHHPLLPVEVDYIILVAVAARCRPRTRAALWRGRAWRGGRLRLRRRLPALAW